MDNSADASSGTRGEERAGLLPRVAGQGAKDVTLSQGEVARVLRQNGLCTGLHSSARFVLGKNVSQFSFALSNFVFEFSRRPVYNKCSANFIVKFDKRTGNTALFNCVKKCCPECAAFRAHILRKQVSLTHAEGRSP